MIGWLYLGGKGGEEGRRRGGAMRDGALRDVSLSIQCHPALESQTRTTVWDSKPKGLDFMIGWL